LESLATYFASFTKVLNKEKIFALDKIANASSELPNDDTLWLGPAVKGNDKFSLSPKRTGFIFFKLKSFQNFNCSESTSSQSSLNILLLIEDTEGNNALKFELVREEKFDFPTRTYLSAEMLDRSGSFQEPLKPL